MYNKTRGKKMNEKKIELKESQEYITLNVLLKISHIISTGGEAKFFLANNKIIVNGEEETRRGRKLYPGDTIIYQNKKFLIIKHDS